MPKPAPHLIIDSASHISTTPEIWARYLDPEGFDRSLLMPESAWGPAGVRDTQVGNAMSGAYDDDLHDFAGRQPTRLFGIGVLNAADPAHAIREMRRWSSTAGKIPRGRRWPRNPQRRPEPPPIHHSAMIVP